MIKVLGILLCAFIAAASAEEVISEAEIEKFFQLGTKLKYGDSCDYEVERIRQNLALSGSAETDPNKRLAAVFAFARYIVSRNVPLCSAPDLLLCNKETRKCDCGEVDKWAVFGTSMTKLYKVEDGECRKVEGTSCVPDDYLEQVGIMGSECVSSAKCISQEDGRECSAATYYRYVLGNRQKSRLELFKDSAKGKICTCERANNFVEVDQDNDDATWYENHARRRRQAKPAFSEARLELTLGPFAKFVESL